jgi:hypothetical protein
VLNKQVLFLHYLALFSLYLQLLTGFLFANRIGFRMCLAAVVHPEGLGRSSPPEPVLTPARQGEAPPDAGTSRAASPERMNPQMNRCSVSVWFMRWSPGHAGSPGSGGASPYRAGGYDAKQKQASSLSPG